MGSSIIWGIPLADRRHLERVTGQPPHVQPGYRAISQHGSTPWTPGVHHGRHSVALPRGGSATKNAPVRAGADIRSDWPLRRLNTYTDDAPSLRRARPSQPLFPRSPTNRIRRAVACGSVIGFRYSASTEKLVYVCSNSKMVAATHNADDVKVFSWDNEMFSHLPAVGNV